MKGIIAAIVLASSLGTFASASDGKYEVGASLFDSLPFSGDFKDTVKSSLGVGVYGDYKISSMFAAGVEGGYAFGHELKAKTSVDYICTNYGIRGKYIKEVNVGSAKGRVYGILGIAAYDWTADPDSDKDHNIDTTKIGFNVGAGADVEFMPQWVAGLELRYHVLKMGGDNWNTMAPTVKVGYIF